ncbi:hypothetical protein D0869_07849 [Hortaea werneckii]|uniref:Dolichol phosphate-mannose biosynthesis regulatory protein n=1 Tax=Hortaea werneckii TaxID=91943 RepID=A0A3M6WNF2_HORWE|nr:hypothetical protein D0869_07849 [Hortaea werneckii]
MPRLIEQDGQSLTSHQLDRVVGLAMLVIASTVFLYYTIWTLLLPFVDSNHPIQSLFPPRVWAIRIPVILLLLGGAVVGSFLSVVMIRSNRKKAMKARQKAEAAKSK